MKYQIAWRQKNTTFLHFGPKLFDDRTEAEELAEGLTLEHPQYDHGVQECDDDGHHIGAVWFPEEERTNAIESRLMGEVVRPNETESEDGVTGAILDLQERLQEAVPKEQHGICPGQTDTEPSSPACGL